MTQQYIRQMISRLAKRAELDKRCHPHGLRHTYASLLALKGTPMHLIEQQLGHGSLQTTSIYLDSVAPGEALVTIRRLEGEPTGSPDAKDEQIATLRAELEEQRLMLEKLTELESSTQ